jgi:hypothetical protein
LVPWSLDSLLHALVIDSDAQVCGRPWQSAGLPAAAFRTELPKRFDFDYVQIHPKSGVNFTSIAQRPEKSGIYPKLLPCDSLLIDAVSALPRF